MHALFSFSFEGIILKIDSYNGALVIDYTANDTGCLPVSAPSNPFYCVRFSSLQHSKMNQSVSCCKR